MMESIAGGAHVNTSVHLSVYHIFKWPSYSEEELSYTELVNVDYLFLLEDSFVLQSGKFLNGVLKALNSVRQVTL
jgi:hypothetical protein